jgi:hypothetical protein
MVVNEMPARELEHTFEQLLAHDERVREEFDQLNQLLAEIDEHPVAENDTAAGRQRNRRVVIVIMAGRDRVPNDQAELHALRLSRADTAAADDSQPDRAQSCRLVRDASRWYQDWRTERWLLYLELQQAGLGGQQRGQQLLGLDPFRSQLTA